jgi:hypothetical protein
MISDALPEKPCGSGGVRVETLFSLEKFERGEIVSPVGSIASNGCRVLIWRRPMRVIVARSNFFNPRCFFSRFSGNRDAKFHEIFAERCLDGCP